jgi:hypothetical protein
MKRKTPFIFLSLLAAGSASAQGLYYAGDDAGKPLPLKWVVGSNLVFDDNVSPGVADANGDAVKDGSFALNPYVGASLLNTTPQTTIDVYARLGLIYYFDAPDGMDDVSSQSRAGLNITHRLSERLRFVSRNFISYELEPDYSYGYAASRLSGEYLFWQVDNSLGYRWTERFATYTGLRLSGTTYADVENNDRFTWEIYNQFRYQVSAQSVLTADYRYAQTAGDGISSDSSDNYLLAGVEHRFSPNTIGIVRAGAQFHSVDNGSDNTSPYLEFALNSQVNSQFMIRSYARYGIESYDTVQRYDATLAAALDDVEFDDRTSLRIGVSGNYAYSPTLAFFSGIDYIPTTYAGGRTIPGRVSVADQEENILNVYVGLNVKITEIVTGTVAYNFSNSSSDFAGRDYDRNRISVGVSAEF